MTPIDFAPLIDQVLLPLLAAVLTATATWVLSKVAAYFHFAVQDGQRQLVEQAIFNGLGYAQHQLGPYETAQADAHVAQAVGYAVRKVPDALKALGITPEHLGDLVTARLPPAKPNG